MTHTHRRGISTVEVLVGVMLSLLILGVLYAFQRWQYQAFARQSAYVQSQNLTRNVIDAIARDLRMAAFDPLGAALPAAGPCCPGNRRGIVEAAVDRLHFQQDLNGDGDVADDGEDVTYATAAGGIARTDAGVTTELASNIPAGGLTFRYFDGSSPPVEFVPAGTPAELNQCQRDCVAKVQVAVRAAIPSPDPMNPVAVRSQAASQVAIRNRSLDNF
jgi:Tfp pilus assembly protein PilW